MRKNRRAMAFIVIALLSALLLSSVNLTVTASAGDSDGFDLDFLRSALFEIIPQEQPYSIYNAVREKTEAKTGFYDIAKSAACTGKVLSSYQAGIQRFENGAYIDGKWVPDYERLTGYIEKALEIYSENESKLGLTDAARARSIIMYAYDSLPVRQRIKLENAPAWLAGGCPADGEDSFIPAFAGECVSRGMAGETDGTIIKSSAYNTAYRAIRKDRDGYKENCFVFIPDSENSRLEITVPEGAEAYCALLSYDLSYDRGTDGDKADIYATVCTKDKSGNVIDTVTLGICEGYENRHGFELTGAASVVYSFYGAADNTDFLVLGCPAFLRSKEEEKAGGVGSVYGFSTGITGDVNQNTVIDSGDIECLKQIVLTGNTAPLYVCDTNRDNIISYHDCIHLTNYIIYIKNMKNEIKVTEDNRGCAAVYTLGDSIARGYGLGAEGIDGSSTLAYGALIAQEIASAYDCKVDYANYGCDGDKTADLMSKLSGTYRKDGQKLSANEAVENADLLVVSIGGNDFLKALGGVFSEKLKIDFTDFSKPFELDVWALAKLMASDTIDSTLESAASRYSDEMNALLDRIFALNPDVRVVITTIPNATVKSSLEYRISDGDNYNVPVIKSLYECVNEWLCYFNEVIKDRFGGYKNDNLIICDVDTVFDGSAELALMELDQSLYINDFIKGDFTGIRHPDIHPSAKGHKEMADEHIKALADIIPSFIRPPEKENEPFVPEPYIYLPYDKGEAAVPELSADALYTENNNEIELSVLFKGTGDYSTLVFEIIFDGERLVPLISDVKAVNAHISDNSIRLIIDSGNSMANGFSYSQRFGIIEGSVKEEGSREHELRLELSAVDATAAEDILHEATLVKKLAGKAPDNPNEYNGEAAAPVTVYGADDGARGKLAVYILIAAVMLLAAASVITVAVVKVKSAKADIKK